MFTSNQIAIINTLHQEPNYEFNGNEATVAKRMMKSGWLASTGKKQYRVTAQGNKLYDQYLKENGTSRKDSRIA